MKYESLRTWSKGIGRIAMAIAALSTVAVAQGVFAPPILHAAGTNSSPEAITAGDWNGDGFDDLAVCADSPPNITVLLNDGLGGFPTATTIINNPGTRIQNADLNGDGNLDIIVTDRGSDTVQIYRGFGNGTFDVSGVIVLVFASSATLEDFAVVDLNGDGLLDLAIANRGTNKVEVLHQDGTAGLFSPALSWSHATTTLSTASRPYAVVAFDADGDGDADLAVTNRTLNDVVLFTNGGGGFAGGTPFPASIATTGNGPQSIVAGDVNGDGLTDLVVGNNGAGSITVLTRTATPGTFSTRTFVGSCCVEQVLLADVEGDGDLDVVTANRTNVVANTAGFFFNDGTGCFAPTGCPAPGPGVFPGGFLASAGGGDASGVAARDFNGDTLVDFAFSIDNVDAVAIHRNMSPQVGPYPGTQEDFTLYGGAAVPPAAFAFTTGPLGDVTMVPPGSVLGVHLVSLGGTFSFRPLILLGDLFTTGSPPAGLAPGIAVGAGVFVLVNGQSGPAGLGQLLGPSGTTYFYPAPPLPMGTSVRLQGLILTNVAGNGIYATTDAHEFRF